MALWFTTRLAHIILTDEEDAELSSPFRINAVKCSSPHTAESLTLYRLTPDTLAWIVGMISRARAKNVSGGLGRATLLEFERRYERISDWATSNFSATEITGAKKRGGSLPVEPTFTYPKH